MKIQFTFLWILFTTQTLIAQKNPYEVMFSYEIEQELAEGILSSSKAGLFYTLIGDYHIAMHCSDHSVSWGVDSLDLTEYAFSNALDEISNAAKNHQIVIISENHLQVQHRIFSKKIISELSKNGFNHLGLETFTHVTDDNMLLDSTLSDRGYPLNSPLTGTYTLEPKMGNLVRSAIEENYILFAYEKFNKVKGKDRDELQADNIIKY